MKYPSEPRRGNAFRTSQRIVDAQISCAIERSVVLEREPQTASLPMIWLACRKDCPSLYAYDDACTMEELARASGEEDKALQALDRVISDYETKMTRHPSILASQ